MKTLHLIPLLLAVVLAAPIPSAFSATAVKAETSAQRTFASPEDAAAALIAAAHASDRQAIFSIMGAGSSSWLPSGDAAGDREDWIRFVTAYETKHLIVPGPDGRATLVVGNEEWPFPAPLMRRGDTWFFDAATGREEVIRRRIGRNELDTMQTLLAIVDAQREYASDDPDGNGFHDYARRFISTPGKRDGLYWPVEEGARPSPLGPLIGTAASSIRASYSGNPDHSGPGSYHGYRYRLLEAQGKAAPGGAYDYRVGDKLIGGFAVVAYPREYGVSGVMTFMINHDGVLYEKNLGAKTERIVLEMKLFNPDASWKKGQ